MIAPDEIRTGSCLIVMGSEGRREQTLRTDQDNGLILAGPVDSAALDAFRSDFSGALADFGFPPCPATSWCAIRFGQSRSRTISRISAAGWHCLTKRPI